MKQLASEETVVEPELKTNGKEIDYTKSYDLDEVSPVYWNSAHTKEISMSIEQVTAGAKARLEKATFQRGTSVKCKGVPGVGKVVRFQPAKPGGFAAFYVVNFGGPSSKEIPAEWVTSA